METARANGRPFVYDGLGRRTQEKCTTAAGDCTASRVFTYTFDAADQLTEANEPNSRHTSAG